METIKLTLEIISAATFAAKTGKTVEQAIGDILYKLKEIDPEAFKRQLERI